MLQCGMLGFHQEKLDISIMISLKEMLNHHYNLRNQNNFKCTSSPECWVKNVLRSSKLLLILTEARSAGKFG